MRTRSKRQEARTTRNGQVALDSVFHLDISSIAWLLPLSCAIHRFLDFNDQTTGSCSAHPPPKSSIHNEHLPGNVYKKPDPAGPRRRPPSSGSLKPVRMSIQVHESRQGSTDLDSRGTVHRAAYRTRPYSPVKISSPLPSHARRGSHVHDVRPQPRHGTQVIAGLYT